LGWRPELAPSILSNLDQIDVVEVILDDYFKASSCELRALRTLGEQVPVVYHGVGLGLASAHAADPRRLQSLARVLDFLAPPTWSEHLAFVRADGREIGHLAAPPRTRATVDGTLENLERIKKTVGSAPALENIATLIDPPGSKIAEPQWIEAITRESGCPLLLDLHNLYSNALNFGFDPVNYLHAFPLDRVETVHLSGGMWIPEPPGHQSRPDGKRLLDDHVHDVPPAVFGLLSELAQTVSQPLTVLIERDGEYPEFASLLREIRSAREVLNHARRSRVAREGGPDERAFL
jgi:uncharacterized protein (UPF0276 family)